MPQDDTFRVSIHVPLGPTTGHEYSARHIDVRLSRRHAEIIRRIRNGLAARHVQLANGRHVESNGDVLRWLLESVDCPKPA